MTRLYIVVEGPTEETFVRELLCPHLYPLGIYPVAPLVGKPGHKGGRVTYARARGDVLLLLKQERSAFCTTMFDYFRLGPDFPGERKSASAPALEKAHVVEQAFHADVVQCLGHDFHPDRFIPYIQMHEYESLLFSDTEALARGIGRADLAADLAAIGRQFVSPEDINEGDATAPSKRILALCPSYNKVLCGALAAIDAGLPAIRAQCRHFDAWVSRLEKLGS